MRCPNPQCNYRGYIQSGLCPKCGEKMLPEAHLFESKVKPKPFYAKVIDFWINLFYRTLESILFFIVFYLVLYFGVFVYNMLCEEISEWRPIPFHSWTMHVVKVVAFILIFILDIRYRWHKK